MKFWTQIEDIFNTRVQGFHFESRIVEIWFPEGILTHVQMLLSVFGYPFILIASVCKITVFKNSTTFVYIQWLSQTDHDEWKYIINYISIAFHTPTLSQISITDAEPAEAALWKMKNSKVSFVESLLSPSDPCWQENRKDSYLDKWMVKGRGRD